MIKKIKDNWVFVTGTFAVIFWVVSWAFGIDRSVDAHEAKLISQMSIVELMQVNVREIPVVVYRTAIIEKKVDRMDDKIDLLIQQNSQKK